MRLKARLSEPSSSPAGASSTRVDRSPARMRSLAAIRLEIGRAILVAAAKPIHTAARSSSSATTTKPSAKVIWISERWPSAAL